MPDSARSRSPQPADGHFVMIPLTKGKFTIVDEADVVLVLARGSWKASRGSDRVWHASRSEGYAAIYMHWLITGNPMTDHANGNGLDNRRINLRPATKSLNAINRPPPRNNTSGYKGVSWVKRDRKWQAMIGIGGRPTHLGTFDDPVEAARAYNRAALEAFGEYAWLNPLPETTGSPAA